MKAVPLYNILGSFAEHNKELMVTLAKLESWSMKRAISQTSIDHPIFICGLARSGTSIILEILSENNELASYRYADFPFPHLPTWWGRFHNAHLKKDQAAVERSHGDGIKVTPQSPEAMEEIVWDHFFPQSHDPLLDSRLSAVETYTDFESFYRNTIAKLLIREDATRYLAKNNYNIARLNYLCSLFPDARFILTVRDPVWQIASLMKQQRLLSSQERHDKRLLKYMQHSKHFEFGLDRRPINPGSTPRISSIQRLWDEGQEVKGWAEYWSMVYEYLADLLDNNVAVKTSSLLVDYEDLCSHPRETLEHVYTHTDLPLKKGLIEKQASILKRPSYYAPQFNPTVIDLIRSKTMENYRRIRGHL